MAGPVYFKQKCVFSPLHKLRDRMLQFIDIELEVFVLFYYLNREPLEINLFTGRDYRETRYESESKQVTLHNKLVLQSRIFTLKYLYRM